MSNPEWLDLQTVLFIHNSAIQQAGGSQGVRDAGLLESALARPKNLLRAVVKSIGIKKKEPPKNLGLMQSLLFGKAYGHRCLLFQPLFVS